VRDLRGDRTPLDFARSQSFGFAQDRSFVEIQDKGTPVVLIKIGMSMVRTPNTEKRSADSANP
jgi:hypothetical protein